MAPTQRTRHQRRATTASRNLHLTTLLLLLLSAHVCSAALTITSTWDANTGAYYSALTTAHSSIFAGNTIVISSGDATYDTYNYAGGHRTLYTIPGMNSNASVPTAQLINTQTTAFRADAVSELMVAMAVMYLDSKGELPFARSAGIPMAYLPTTATTATTFVNPAFPSIPITLDMLLLHTSSLLDSSWSFGEAMATAETVPTLSAFVADVFTAPSTLFNTRTEPGLNTSYSFARTNSAIAAYVVEQVLATSVNYSGYDGIGEFVFAVLLRPLLLVNTFLLDTSGEYRVSSYPMTTASSFDDRTRVSIQDITSDGMAVQDSFPIHAAYFSDYMFYTCAADLATLANALFTAEGTYYSMIGAPLLQTTINVPNMPTNYTTGRAPGLFLFDANALCTTLYSAISYSGTAPYCTYAAAGASSNPLPTAAPPFGLMAHGGTNEVAVICMPLANGSTYCSVSELSYYTTSTWPIGAAVTAADMAVGYAMVNLARLTSDPKPTTTTSTTFPPMEKTVTPSNGWFIFLGVVAVLVVVVVAAYGVDYMIQPPPPAKIVAPVRAGPTMGTRAGTALREAGMRGMGGDDDDAAVLGGGGAAGLANTPARGGRSERRHRRRSGASTASDDEDLSGEEYEEETPYILRSSSRQGGSSLRRRRHRGAPEAPSSVGVPRRGGGGEGRAPPSEGGEEEDDSYLYSSPEDGWGGRSSTGSQQVNAREALHFDAYI